MLYSTQERSGRTLWRSTLWVAVALAFAAGFSACGPADAPVANQEATDAETDRPASGETPPAAVPAPTTDTEGQPAPPDEADARVAIQVNAQVMTQADFDRELQEQMQRLEQQLGGMQPSPEMAQRFAMIREQMKHQLVEQSVTRMLMEDYLERSDIEVSEEEVDRHWNEIVAQFPDAAAFEQRIQAEGMSVAEVREQVARQTKFEKLMDQELGDTEVTDAEAKAFYETQPEEFSQPTQVRARHILLKEQAGAKEAIEALHQQIEEGADFAKLAEEHSDCPSSAQGGDLGFFGEGQMVEPFARQAFAMKPGEVSPPVQTQFGYHIIKVEERRDAKQADFDEVQEAIKQHLGQQRVQVQQEALIGRLREEANITVNVELPAAPPSLFPEAGMIDP